MKNKNRGKTQESASLLNAAAATKTETTQSNRTSQVQVTLEEVITEVLLQLIELIIHT